LGEDISRAIPGVRATVVEGGSVLNLKALENEQFQLALSNGQTVPEALQGIAGFDRPAENIRTIASLYPNVFYIVVREDSDIHTIEGLRGQRVTPGIRGYSGELALQEILELAGLSYDDLRSVNYVSTTDGANLLRDGNVDALTGMLNLPNATLLELDATVGIRIIPIPEEIVTTLRERNDGYLRYTIGGGAYPGIQEDVTTVAGYTILLAHADLPEDFVYTITETLFENRDKYATLSSAMRDFNPEFSAETMVGPLHPGALRYYNEQGLLMDR
jgi:TRAP transporter TAXI family solute receptor